uniref:TIR domain-containing protein n=1 Tax=Macrostomum lignano TaxID=282301 RepID=A0A1I8FJT6_9PLAT
RCFASLRGPRPPLTAIPACPATAAAASPLACTRAASVSAAAAPDSAAAGRAIPAAQLIGGSEQQPGWYRRWRKRPLEQLLGGDADLLQGRHSGRSAAKDMLISYVRAEAAHGAVAVCSKEKLTALGCSVFLVRCRRDRSGSDWQDALNDAVAATEVFIPLVTPRYGAHPSGRNREVKLADVLGKEILPISFISDWPPRCLAIQFATTQFVPWSGAYDIESNINDEAGRGCRGDPAVKFDANKAAPAGVPSRMREEARWAPSFKRKPTCLSIMSRQVNQVPSVQEAAAAGTSMPLLLPLLQQLARAGGGDSAGSQGSSIGNE